MECKYKLLLTTLIILILSSCERVILIDLPDSQNLIVVNGIITPGYGSWVNLSRSVDIRANEASSYIPLTNAELKIYKDGNGEYFKWHKRKYYVNEGKQLGQGENNKN